MLLLLMTRKVSCGASESPAGKGPCSPAASPYMSHVVDLPAPTKGKRPAAAHAHAAAFPHFCFKSTDGSLHTQQSQPDTCARLCAARDGVEVKTHISGSYEYHAGMSDNVHHSDILSILSFNKHPDRESGRENTHPRQEGGRSVLVIQ